MAKFTMQIGTTHPILFVADSSPDISLPNEIGSAFAAATDNCIAFAVMPFVDGASLVTVTDEACTYAGTRLFSGSLNAPSGIVTLMDSSLFKYLNVPVPNGRIAIDFWADDDQNPDWVWIRLGAIRDI
jgi:hypothetical protein